MPYMEWLRDEAKDCGLCDPPLNAQKAIHFLKDYLLGSDWYVSMPENAEQVNSAIVFAILEKYSRKFRKECRKHSKIARKR